MLGRGVVGARGQWDHQARKLLGPATDRGMPVRIGRRKAWVSMILVVDALAAYQAGTPFYRCADVVWLADGT